MVSVIVPAYNAAAYLCECLESALAQTYRDIEVIVVDDGSLDSTPEIIAGFEASDPRVRSIRQANGGLSAARNSAIASARGEWITFLDADDLLTPDSLAVLMSAAESTGCSLVYGGWRRVTDSAVATDSAVTTDSAVATDSTVTEAAADARVSRSSAKPHVPSSAKPHTGSSAKSGRSGVKSDVRVMPATEVVAEVLYQTSSLIPTAWAKLYRRSLFDGLRFRPGITYEDLDVFYMLAFEAGRVAVTDAPVYLYRDNPTSITNTFSPSRFDVLDVTARLEAYMSARHPELLAAARDRRLSANFNIYGLLAVHDAEGRHAAVAEGCMAVVKSYRRASLLNPRVRLKNKLAILLSCLGEGALKRVSPFVYGRKGK